MYLRYHLSVLTVFSSEEVAQATAFPKTLPSLRTQLMRDRWGRLGPKVQNSVSWYPHVSCNTNMGLLL